MPQQNFSGKIGKSSSSVVQRVISNSTNVQQPVVVPGAVKTSFNKQPVPVK